MCGIGAGWRARGAVCGGRNRIFVGAAAAIYGDFGYADGWRRGAYPGAREFFVSLEVRVGRLVLGGPGGGSSW